jgi:signal transduction histidine kinase
MNPLLMARLTAPIAAVSGLLLVLTIVAAWYVRDMQQRASGPIATSVASVIAAQELEISIRAMNSQFNRYLITLDRDDLKPVDRLRARTDAALANAKREATTPAELALMERVENGLKHLFEEYEKAKSRPPKQGFYQEIRKLTEEVLEKEILAPAHEYLRLNEGMLTQANETNQQVAERLTVGLIALGLFGSVGGLLAGWVIASAVRRSIQRTEERLRNTAEQLAGAIPKAEQSAGEKKVQDTMERVATSVSAVLRRLEKSEQDALRAEQLASVGQMAAGIAHEVRNPLTAIKILIQAAGERSGSLPMRDVRVLEEEIGRLEEIVSGFLDFARPPRPELRPVDVKPLVEQVVENFRAKAEAQGVALSLSARDVHAVADPNQLRQVVYNLLFNALDAQPNGGHITVTLGPDRGGTGGLILTVKDGGPGIPPELESRIFEPFVSTKATGLGLGLSVCRRIAESHGGTLTAASSSEGAVFTLTLPAARTAEVLAPA